MATIHIGISGWRYAPWRGDFYPKGLAQKRELQFASRAVNSIEINGSFYALQRPERYAQWYDETPDGLRVQRQGAALHHPRQAPARHRKTAGEFLCLGSAGAEGKTRADPLAVSAEFQIRCRALRTLPRSNCPTIPNRPPPSPASTTRTSRPRQPEGLQETALRHAVEIRHESFIDPAFVRLLKRYNTALVIADTAGKWPYREDITSDFVYLRLHGAEELYASGYTATSAKTLGRTHRSLASRQTTGGPTIDRAHGKSPRRANPARCSAISITTSKSARPLMHATCCSACISIKTSPLPPASLPPKECCHEHSRAGQRQRTIRHKPSTGQSRFTVLTVNTHKGFTALEPALHPAGTA